MIEQLSSIFTGDFGNTLLRFLICLVVNWIIVDRFYYRKAHRRDFYFTFMLISVAIFFLVYFMMGMDRGKATMGVGLGLFGIFSIMRYRTDTMPVREMTYLFIIVCLSVVHAMINIEQELPNHFADLAASGHQGHQGRCRRRRFPQGNSRAQSDLRQPGHQ